jgi:hypothetical protein
VKSSQELGAVQSGWSETLPVTLGVTNGPPDHEVVGLVAVMVPYDGVDASAWLRVRDPPHRAAIATIPRTRLLNLRRPAATIGCLSVVRRCGADVLDCDPVGVQLFNEMIPPGSRH